jgi:hypothetical protein
MPFLCLFINTASTAKTVTVHQHGIANQNSYISRLKSKNRKIRCEKREVTYLVLKVKTEKSDAKKEKNETEKKKIFPVFLKIIRKDRHRRLFCKTRFCHCRNGY